MVFSLVNRDSFRKYCLMMSLLVWYASHHQGSCFPSTRKAASHLQGKLLPIFKGSCFPSTREAASHLQGSCFPSTREAASHLQGSCFPSTREAASHLQGKLLPIFKEAASHLQGKLLHIFKGTLLPSVLLTTPYFLYTYFHFRICNPIMLQASGCSTSHL